MTVTPVMMFFVGAAFGDWLAEQLNKPVSSLKISIGSDPRLSSPSFLAAMATGLASRGVSVARFGLATTPAMFMSCVMEGYNYDGAI